MSEFDRSEEKKNLKLDNVNFAGRTTLADSEIKRTINDSVLFKIAVTTKIIKNNYFWDNKLI